MPQVNKRYYKVLVKIKELIRLYQKRFNKNYYSANIVLVIFFASIGSSTAYGFYTLLRRILSVYEEKREFSKLRYYNLLNDKDASQSEFFRSYQNSKDSNNSKTHLKSLLRQISFVGFNRNDITSGNFNVKTVYIKQESKNRVKKLLINKVDNDFFTKNYFLFKSFSKNLKNYANSKGLFNSKIFQKLFIIWNILIPNFFNKNTYLLTAQILFLMLRTYLTVLITKLDGQIIKDIINRNFKKFLTDMLYWFIIAFPSSYINSGIKFFEKRLALNFRTNLVRYIHDLYLNDRMVFYRINEFNNDNNNETTAGDKQSEKKLGRNRTHSDYINESTREFKPITNIDQYITSDITKFCDSLTALISNLGKPVIDLFIFSIYLRDNLGNFGITGLFLNYLISAVYLKRISPKFGELTKKQQLLEGEYFNYHFNLVNNSEEIAFYNGLTVEKGKTLGIFNRLIKHLDMTNKLKINFNFSEEYILKIIWNFFGYIFASLPILSNRSGFGANSGKQTSIRTFIVNKRLISSLSDAGSRLIYSIKDISTLTGYIDRIFNLLYQLHYSNSLVNNGIKGTLQEDYNGLRLEKVSIIVPSTNKKLINKLNFQINPEENLLVLGHNGCGKSAMLKVVAKLWPFYKGLLSKPKDEDILFIHQIPYFITNGTLRDQIIYPYTEIQFYEKGYIDQDLIEILKLVKLEYLLDNRDRDLNSVEDWSNVLSGGEKQRMNFARIFFRNPEFVILDESTNAISNDIEDYLYKLLKQKNITFITLSHRPILIKYHDYLLNILPTSDNVDKNDDKNWTFETLGTQFAIQSIENEIDSISKSLNNEDSLIKRKMEIDKLLADEHDDE